MHFPFLFCVKNLGASRSFLVQMDWTTTQAQSIWTRNCRDAPKFLTQNIYFLQKQCGSFKLVGKGPMLLRITAFLGKGSPNAGTLVAQVLHWFYVGRPRATTSYRACTCVNVLLSSEKDPLSLLRKVVQVHSIQSVFGRCAHVYIFCF